MAEIHSTVTLSLKDALIIIRRHYEILMYNALNTNSSDVDDKFEIDIIIEGVNSPDKAE